MARLQEPTIKETHDVFLEHACQALEYDETVYRALLAGAREIRVELPLEKDDGSLVVYNAYRVQHHNSRGPYKGGMRYHPDIDIEEMRGLACLMTLKTARVNIPLGGAKGGVDCDPSVLTKKELETLTRRFVERIHRNIGPNLDIRAPDVGPDASVMGWTAGAVKHRGLGRVLLVRQRALFLPRRRLPDRYDSNQRRLLCFRVLGQRSATLRASKNVDPSARILHPADRHGYCNDLKPRESEREPGYGPNYSKLAARVHGAIIYSLD